MKVLWNKATIFSQILHYKKFLLKSYQIVNRLAMDFFLFSNSTKKAPFKGFLAERSILSVRYAHYHAWVWAFSLPIRSAAQTRSNTPIHRQKKKPTQGGFSSFWRRERDSNYLLFRLLNRLQYIYILKKLIYKGFDIIFLEPKTN